MQAAINQQISFRIGSPVSARLPTKIWPRARGAATQRVAAPENPKDGDTGTWLVYVNR